jgi:osmotically-inducible protein OsmY
MKPTNDELIKKGVARQLMQDESLNAGNINVEVSNGKVILKGTVNSHSDKISARENAYRVLGVKQIENKLKVKYQPEQVKPIEEKAKVYRMMRKLFQINELKN